jgi:hypothetical protein
MVTDLGSGSNFGGNTGPSYSSVSHFISQFPSSPSFHLKEILPKTIMHDKAIIL